MKLDATVMRTMGRQDFRVLTAVETGMKNHQLVPLQLITSIANLRHGGTIKVLSSLLRDKLLSHDRSCGYDGYRLTNCGYDILALHNLKSRGFIAALGDRIGTGKESDVYVAARPDGKQVVLKIHRLGRTSFRDVKKKRDYFMVNAVSKNKKRGTQFRQQPNSWLFLSRISALKEFAFMKALHQNDYPTPTPLGHNRHIVVMSLVRGIPLYQMQSNRVSAEQAESIFEQSTVLASRLASNGLVHCDLNEFNLMVDLSGIQERISDDSDHYVRHSGMTVVSKGVLSAHRPIQSNHIDGTGELVKEPIMEPHAFLTNGEPKPIVTLIDFPQMVSTLHPNAQELYERDLNCLKRFFVMKLKCVPEEGWDHQLPKWDEVIISPFDNEDASVVVPDNALPCLASNAQLRLDKELQASGFSEDDANRKIELHYYQEDINNQNQVIMEDEEFFESENIGELQEGSTMEGDADNYTCNDVDVPDDNTLALVEFDDDQRSVFTEYSRAIAEEKARLRVKQQLEERKKKSSRKDAFRSRNSNKTFIKGKRVYNDSNF
mmetsp:Transcript_37290/g.42594  ORF Transcript_37290/g.42594 Transcript_37290/m.42594 type:complete len:547 (+) Transcript_37290:171-1811(+)